LGNLPIGNFTVVGMAGILSGLFHAPLTAIFLIIEITGGYDLMVPLMIVSSISFAVSKQFEKHSMDVKPLADSGDVFTSDKDKNILLNIDLLQLLQSDVRTLKTTSKTEDLIGLLADTNQQMFPVLDDKNNLVGVIDLNDIRPIIFNAYRVKFTPLTELIVAPKSVINHDEGMETVMEKFESSHTDLLPVLNNRKFAGLISKIDLLERYREKLKEMIIE